MGCRAIIKEFLKSNLGVAAVVFGITVPLMVTGVGVSVDLAQTYLVRERLSHAVDAAALAAAASSSDDPEEVEEKVHDFIEANYPPDKVGFTMDIEVTQSGDVLNVGATARLDTAFMKVVGTPHVDVFVESEVQREVKAIEVVLVMDVTGSMATDNNIATLRTAATNFVNVMFERTNDLEFLKIGLVPFSSSVNVGRYGFGKTPAGLEYDDPFMLNPLNLSYSTTDTSKWMGCVVEGEYPDDIEDHEGPWQMYRYCRNPTTDSPICDRTYNSYTKKYTANQNANYLCPKTPVVPLTNNKTELLSTISKLKADGNTYIGNGLTWGLRLISPEFPFAEGVEWGDEDWKKALILMTDGVNTMHQYYSIYGPTANHDLEPEDLNDRMSEVCDILKEKEVLVYTITFDDGVDEDTKAMFEECATEPNMWYDAPTQAKLIEVYGKIAKELSNLHLSK